MRELRRRDGDMSLPFAGGDIRHADALGWHLRLRRVVTQVLEDHQSAQRGACRLAAGDCGDVDVLVHPRFDHAQADAARRHVLASVEIVVAINRPPAHRGRDLAQVRPRRLRRLRRVDIRRAGVGVHGDPFGEGIEESQPAEALRLRPGDHQRQRRGPRDRLLGHRRPTAVSRCLPRRRGHGRPGHRIGETTRQQQRAPQLALPDLAIVRRFAVREAERAGRQSGRRNITMDRSGRLGKGYPLLVPGHVAGMGNIRSQRTDFHRIRRHQRAHRLRRLEGDAQVLCRIGRLRRLPRAMRRDVSTCAQQAQ